MLIEPLEYHKALSLREEIRTNGNSPLKIVGDDYEMYVVKNSKSKNPPTDIINEVLCYYFLKCWDLPVAKAALMDVNSELLLPEYSAHHHKLYYQQPVFASHWIDYAIEANQFFKIHRKTDKDRFLNPFDLFKIGLFDIWVENDDRKPTNQNLLFRPVNEKVEIVPIDHSFVFSSMTYKSLAPDLFAPIANDNILITDLAESLKPYKTQEKDKAIKNDRNNFYLCISRCQDNFDHIIKTLPSEWNFKQRDADRLSNFLFDKARNKAVFEDYLTKVYL